MYLDYFNLERRPFEQLPDPQFLFLTDQHEEALTRMRFLPAIDDSFAIITGEIGSGKTTLVRKLLSDIEGECTPIFLTHTRLTDIELLQLILVEFGMRPFSMGKIEMITELKLRIDEQHRAGKRVVIVVDEAQNLDIDTLEELRLLTCLDGVDRKALNIILLGQPELSRTLKSPKLDQLRQRCRLRYHLPGLSKDETRDYIRHRVSIAAGRETDLFDKQALAAIFIHTRGLPRLVNTLCDTAMMMACISERPAVSTDSVDEAIKELGWPRIGVPDTADDGDGQSEALLTIRVNDEQVDEIRLTQPHYMIGRASDCSIHIRSKFLSRYHALLTYDDDSWSILDLKSTNGIKVNGVPKKGSVLRDGDIVEIGIHQFRFDFRRLPNRPQQESDLPDIGEATPETVVLDEDSPVTDALAKRS